MDYVKASRYAQFWKWLHSLQQIRWPEKSFLTGQLYGYFGSLIRRHSNFCLQKDAIGCLKVVNLTFHRLHYLSWIVSWNILILAAFSCVQSCCICGQRVSLPNDVLLSMYPLVSGANKRCKTRWLDILVLKLQKFCMTLSTAWAVTMIVGRSHFWSYALCSWWAERIQFHFGPCMQLDYRELLLVRPNSCMCDWQLTVKLQSPFRWLFLQFLSTYWVCINTEKKTKW